MTEVTIKNFQSVSDAKFSIDGFTVIVGKNNIGKSAIIRSINAALTNQTGDDFIRTGTKSTEVSIVRKDIDIKWRKGDSASYIINKDEKNPYTKLNRAVPKPILDAGFRNIEVDDDLKINPLYASQFEPVFLLNKPGPQVTEILSEVYDINVISRADDLCQKEIRAAKSLLKTRTADQEALNADLEKFKAFDGIKDEMSRIHALESSCSALNNEIKNLNELMNTLDALKLSVFRLKGITKISIPDTSVQENALSECQWISSKYSEIVKVSAKVQMLKQLSSIKIPDSKGHDEDIQAVEYLKKSNDTLRNQAVLVKKLKAASQCLYEFTPATLMNSIEGTQHDLTWIQDRYKALTELATSIKGLKQSMTTMDESLSKVMKEKSEYTTCPACGKPLESAK